MVMKASWTGPVPMITVVKVTVFVWYSTSYRVGGFEAELDRIQQPTAPVSIPYEVDGKRVLVGGAGKPNYTFEISSALGQFGSTLVFLSRQNFRDGCMARNDPQFLTGKTLLVVTGERAEESKARSTYPVFGGALQTIVLATVLFVSLTIGGQCINGQKKVICLICPGSSPSYYLGWARASCLPCVFGNKNQWSTIRFIAPENSNALP